MKLNELFEALEKALRYDVVIDRPGIYKAVFTAGKRRIVFNATNEYTPELDGPEDEDPGEWMIDFLEQIPKLTAPHIKTYHETDQLTGSGNEFAVFATLKKILQKFIQDKKPQMITFSADDNNGKNNRPRLYAKMFKKNLPPGWQLQQEPKTNHMPTYFMMVKEGMMKRSDPYISGEKSGPRPPDVEPSRRPTTSHRSKLETLVKKSGKSMEKVEAAWNKAANETPDGPKKWANVMIRAKADLGISI